MPRPSDPSARSKLLAAAEHVFVARGLDGAKVEEITARAGVAKGTFYLHFAHKEEAFRQVVEAMVARLAAQLDALPDDCGGAASGGVRAFLDEWVTQDLQIFEFIWKNRGLMGLLLEGGKSAGYRHLVDQFVDRAAAKSRLLLAAGIEAGLYRADLDLDVAASFVAGAYDRLARDVVKETRRPDVDSKLRSLQLLILRGIGSAELLAALAAPKVRVAARTERSKKRARA
jgi:AcrR family transcriptional regulator